MVYKMIQRVLSSGIVVMEKRNEKIDKEDMRKPFSRPACYFRLPPSLTYYV